MQTRLDRNTMQINGRYVYSVPLVFAVTQFIEADPVTPHINGDAHVIVIHPEFVRRGALFGTCTDENKAVCQLRANDGCDGCPFEESVK